MSTLSQEYSKDFYSWALHNAQLIRSGQLSEIDIENIATELETMGRNNKRELINRLAVLIAHLLKWKYQSIKRSKSWVLTIKNQRFELADLLAESPSLRQEVEIKFAHAYEKALILAAAETAMDEQEFPQHSPFSLTECLDFSFLPE